MQILKRISLPRATRDMAPVLWPFSRSIAQKEMDEIKRCMPEAHKPIDWMVETSCTSHSLANMMENCIRTQGKPSMTARLGRITLGLRRKSKSVQTVSFRNQKMVEEIAAMEHTEHEPTAATTFLSAIPRSSSTCLLVCLAEDHECFDDEHSSADSVLSAGNTVSIDDWTSLSRSVSVDDMSNSSSHGSPRTRLNSCDGDNNLFLKWQTVEAGLDAPRLKLC